MKWSPKTVRPASLHALTQSSRNFAEEKSKSLFGQLYRSAMMCSPFIVIPPSKQRSAVGDCTRDLGRSADGGTPLNPGRRVLSFLQRFTQAKNIAVKKCASIIA